MPLLRGGILYFCGIRWRDAQPILAVQSGHVKASGATHVTLGPNFAPKPKVRTHNTAKASFIRQ
ncbi:hypothetical protein BC936DRAFT_143413 [Jimgerdemannia flammicorona]|uniref:Uncharacterized protein n=1 Tax=Jimgerdemannia flammicorona TaxID=994334 RepID=A0A432ZZF9_9FUNG|nr:hypothetical protein BC936DRAFT_143413 [Jimgerdemannia flammicorona]